MPIYAYKCESCGHRQDVLQKLSDAALTACPACGKPDFVKQLTAAGFQLKGSGWYATDFRGGNTAAPAEEGGTKPAESKEAVPAPASPAAGTPAAPAAASPASAGEAGKPSPPASEAA